MLIDRPGRTQYAIAMPKETALILAGAVAKGAFEAGVLQVLAAHAEELNISRVVGASSGALNAAVFATGIRMRAQVQAADQLVQLWEDAATWHNALDLGLRDILTLKGLGSADRVLPLMKKAVAGLSSTNPQPVYLQLVLTALDGRQGNIGGNPATTYEYVVPFSNEAFDSDALREQVFTTALASGAFPVVFAPVDVPHVGPCVDGGSVNNTPLKLVVNGTAVERIIVVTPEPIVSAPPADLAGTNLITRFVEILINERLYRDLHDAESINGYLRQLDGLGLAPDSLERVKAVFRWRPLEIVQIRPERALRGNSFSAFSDASLRAEYIAAGRAAASRALQ
jgi:NTE family protein